jgi:hypothetical protein
MDKRIKGKIFIIIALLLPLFFIIPFFMLISLGKPFILFPGNKVFDLPVWTYNDPDRSMINDFIVKEQNIKLQFIHEKSGSFVGIGINLSKYTDFFDFTPYSHIYITLNTENIETCRLIIKLFVPGITDMNDSSSFRHLGYHFTIKKDQTEYRCPLSAFRDPFWWTRDYNPGRIKLGQDTLKNGCFLLVESSIDESTSIPVNRESSMTITNISLHKSYLFFYILMGGSTACYYLLLFVIICYFHCI